MGSQKTLNGGPSNTISRMGTQKTLNGESKNTCPVMKGPMNSRKLTAVSYVELVDSDVRNRVLKEVKDKTFTYTYNEKTIMIKPALSAVVRERIWAMNTAFDMVKADSKSAGKTVEKRKDGNRVVLVDNVVVFDQGKDIPGCGVFKGAYSTLSLPGK